jgi:hypothetical protein
MAGGMGSRMGSKLETKIKLKVPLPKGDLGGSNLGNDRSFRVGAIVKHKRSF